MIKNPHSKIQILVILLLLFLPFVYSGNFFNVSESFDCTLNPHSHTANNSGSRWYLAYNRNESGNKVNFNCNNPIYIQHGQGNYTIDDSTGLKSGKYISLYDVDSTTYHHASIDIPFQENGTNQCSDDNCYLTRNTRISFNISYQDYALENFPSFPVFGFKRVYKNNDGTRVSYFNYTADGRASSSTYQTELNDSLNGYVSYRTAGLGNIFGCNWTGLHDSGFVNFTIGELDDKSDPDCYIDYNSPIQGFVIGFESDPDGSSTYQGIDDLKITNLLNGTNQLPSFNISLNYSCANSTEDSTRVNFEFSTYDAEGDTLYYFNKENTLYEQNKTTYFYRKYCPSSNFVGSIIAGPLITSLFCSVDKDYGFLDNTIYFTDSCTINTGTYNLSQFNLKYSEADTGDLWGLELQNSCTGVDKAFYYDLGLPSKNVNFVTEVRDLENGDNFNISLLDDNLNEVINVNVNVSDNRLLIRDNGYIKINISRQDNTLFEFYDLDTREKTSVFKVWNSYTYPMITGTYYTANVNLTTYNNSIEYSRFGLNAGNMIIMGIQTRGVTTSLNFSTTQPSHIDVLGYGKRSVTFYVSDSVHQPDEFVSKEISFKVDNCRYDSEAAENTEDYVNTIEDGDLIGFFRAFLGTPFRSYMTVADTTGWGSKIIWWIYVFLFMGIFVWNFLVSKVADIIMPLLVSSVTMLVISLLAGYTAVLAVSLIGLALVLMAMFSNVFKGGTNG